MNEIAKKTKEKKLNKLNPYRDELKAFIKEKKMSINYLSKESKVDDVTLQRFLKGSDIAGSNLIILLEFIRDYEN